MQWHKFTQGIKRFYPNCAATSKTPRPWHTRPDLNNSIASSLSPELSPSGTRPNGRLIQYTRDSALPSGCMRSTETMARVITGRSRSLANGTTTARRANGRTRRPIAPATCPLSSSPWKRPSSTATRSPYREKTRPTRQRENQAKVAMSHSDGAYSIASVLLLSDHSLGPAPCASHGALLGWVEPLTTWSHNYSRDA